MRSILPNGKFETVKITFVDFNSVFDRSHDMALACGHLVTIIDHDSSLHSEVHGNYENTPL